MKLFNLLMCCAIVNMFGITNAVQFRDCGSSKAGVTAVAVYPCNSEPCTLTKGQQSSLVISFVPYQTIYAGKVKVQAGLPYGLVTLPIPDNSVCTHLTPGCPVMPRKQYSYTYTGMLPPQIPSGEWTIKVELQDTNAAPFVCVEMRVRIL